MRELQDIKFGVVPGNGREDRTMNSVTLIIPSWAVIVIVACLLITAVTATLDLINTLLKRKVRQLETKLEWLKGGKHDEA